MAKSPLMVPGAESAGLVAPSILRPVTTAFFPSHTMATTGPEDRKGRKRGGKQRDGHRRKQFQVHKYKILLMNGAYDALT